MPTSSSAPHSTRASKASSACRWSPPASIRSRRLRAAALIPKRRACAARTGLSGARSTHRRSRPARPRRSISATASCRRCCCRRPVPAPAVHQPAACADCRLTANAQSAAAVAAALSPRPTMDELDHSPYPAEAVAVCGADHAGEAGGASHATGVHPPQAEKTASPHAPHADGRETAAPGAEPDSRP